MKNKSNHARHKLKDEITNTLSEFITLDGRSIEAINRPKFIHLFQCFLAVDHTLLE